MNDASTNSMTAPSQSTFEKSVGLDPHEHLPVQEIEALIGSIRSQLRKRDMALNRDAPEDAETNYQFNERLDFGLSGKGQHYLGSGWHVAEPAFTWTDAVHAFLNFNLPASDTDLGLEFTATGYLNSKIRYQNVFVDINGTECCRIPISDKYTFAIIVPRSVLAPNRRLVVQFTCPDRASPSQFKRGADHRILGIALHSLVIREHRVSPANTAAKAEQAGLPSANGHGPFQK